MDEFNEFGAGIICPFQRDGKGDFVNSSGKDILNSDIKELIGIIGPTRTQPGELPWRTDIGSRAMVMRHRNSHPEMLAATAEQLITPVVRMFEPRAIPGQCSVVEDGNPTSKTIRFSYVPSVAMGSGKAETIDFEVNE